MQAVDVRRRPPAAGNERSGEIRRDRLEPVATWIDAFAVVMLAAAAGVAFLAVAPAHLLRR
jgi:hypothetical protein